MVMMKTSEYTFAGFSAPNGTYVPDEFFDELAPNLSEAELRVCLYIIRRTFGFKKNSDNISLKQMVGGIRTREGAVLDHGTGLSKPAVTKGVRGLVDKGVILAMRNSSASRGDEPTTYRLRFASETGLTSFTGGGQRRLHGGVNEVAPQNTEIQHTVITGDSNDSKDAHCGQLVDNSGKTRSRRRAHLTPDATRMIYELFTDFSRKLGDMDHLESNISQASQLYTMSGLELRDFYQAAYDALTATQKTAGVRNRMAFFFAVLRDQVGVETTTGTIQ